MTFDLGTVLSALLAAGIGSAATLIAMLSPSARRIKRLEQLTEIRKDVEGEEALRRIDYATEHLAHQIGEDARNAGDRPLMGMRTWFPFIPILLILLVYLVSGAMEPGAAAVLVVGGIIVATWAASALGFHVVGQRLDENAKIVATELDQRRDHQRSQPAGAEGLTEGDVPPA